MAALDITRVEVTDMQRLVVAWEEVTPAPLNYIVTAVNTDHTIVEVVDGSQRVARLQDQARLLRTYTITVSDGMNTGTPYFQAIDVDPDVTNQLRQAVWDVVYDAEIQGLYVMHDGLFRPDDVEAAEVFDVPFPAFDVQMPEMKSYLQESATRWRETWEVPFRVWAHGGDNDPESVSDAYPFLEAVRRAINESGDLELSARGVLWRAWDFKNPSKIEGRNGASGLECRLSIPVQRMA